jgi:hypothetical protein
MRVLDDRGLLELLPRAVRFTGNRGTIDCLNVQAVAVVRQTVPWLSLALGNLLVLGMVFGGAMSSLTPGNLATIPVLIAVNGLVFVAAGPTKWVRVEYLDPSGDRRCAYFTDGSAFGWGKVFGGTTRLYEAMQAVVLTG